MIKLMYSVFLGLTIVMFVGVGVATFYPEPAEPNDYAGQNINMLSGEPTDEEIAQIEKTQDEMAQRWDEHDTQMKDYSRNVAIITMIIATALLFIAVTQAEKFGGISISEGVLLGGIFTLLYSLVRGLMSGDDIIRFLVISAGLVIALWLGKVKFMPEPQNKPAKK